MPNTYNNALAGAGIGAGIGGLSTLLHSYLTGKGAGSSLSRALTGATMGGLAGGGLGYLRHAPEEVEAASKVRGPSSNKISDNLDSFVTQTGAGAGLGALAGNTGTKYLDELQTKKVVDRRLRDALEVDETKLKNLEADYHTATGATKRKLKNNLDALDAKISKTKMALGLKSIPADKEIRRRVKDLINNRAENELSKIKKRQGYLRRYGLTGAASLGGALVPYLLDDDEKREAAYDALMLGGLVYGGDKGLNYARGKGVNVGNKMRGAAGSIRDKVLKGVKGTRVSELLNNPAISSKLKSINKAFNSAKVRRGIDLLGKTTKGMGARAKKYRKGAPIAAAALPIISYLLGGYSGGDGSTAASASQYMRGE